jgi:hypothetical protein
MAFRMLENVTRKESAIMNQFLVLLIMHRTSAVASFNVVSWHLLGMNMIKVLRKKSWFTTGILIENDQKQQPVASAL